MKRILWLRCILLVALALVVAGAGTQGALALVETPDSGDATDIMMDLESESGTSIVEA